MPTKQIVCACAPLELLVLSAASKALSRQSSCSRHSSANVASSSAMDATAASNDRAHRDSAAPRATTLEVHRRYFRACWLAFVVLYTVSIAVFAGSIGVTRYLQVRDTGYILNLLGDLTWYFLE